MSQKGKQNNPDDYRLQQVDIRLKLMDGPVYYSTKPLTNPEVAVEVMADILKDLDREWVCVVNLDDKLRPLNFNVISIGSINQSVAPIQNIFKAAILTNAAHLMLLHTHPSGDPAPSSEDINLTRRAVQAGKLMDIQVIDHIILGCGTGFTCSMRSLYPEVIKEPLNQQAIDALTRKEKVRKQQKGR